MAKLDGESRELHGGERAAFFRARELRRIQQYDKSAYSFPVGLNREYNFRLVNTRVVERRVSSGHKVLYSNRGIYHG